HKNRTAHTDYIRHTQEEAATLREIVERERLLSPLNTSLDYASADRRVSAANVDILLLLGFEQGFRTLFVNTVAIGLEQIGAAINLNVVRA
nr:hypothetical protein [Tanacetum cinerariifolium]